MKETTSILTATITGEARHGIKKGLVGTDDKTGEQFFFAFRHARGVTLQDNQPTFTPDRIRVEVENEDKVVFTLNSNPNGKNNAARWASKSDWDLVANSGKKPSKAKKSVKKAKSDVAPKPATDDKPKAKKSPKKPGVIAKTKRVVAKVREAIAGSTVEKPEPPVLVRKVKVTFDRKDPTMFRFWKPGVTGQIDFGKLKGLSNPVRMAEKGTLDDDVIVERQLKPGVWELCENNPLKDAPASSSAPAQEPSALPAEQRQPRDIPCCA